MNQNPIFWIIVAIIIFIVAREIMLWYWKINTIVKCQEEQLDLMDKIIAEMYIQNNRTLKILQEIQKSKEEKGLVHRGEHNE